MTHVHYKFSSKLSYDTVVFDGLHVTLRDLKRQIMGREKLRAGDCDLQITNAQNKEEFTDDDGSIPKGSSVIVRRIPIVGGKPNSSKTRNLERSDILTNNAFGAFKAVRNLTLIPPHLFTHRSTKHTSMFKMASYLCLNIRRNVCFGLI
ncbi:hypothetical protein OYC64_006423 [Pagothenia borchgrevinki]|uniref:DWNN domain-containing protein n=1 Tax=Pagothenia borchgrevinki TaxID=8213 RepID=A0ABD2GL36_PAGBO